MTTPNFLDDCSDVLRPSRETTTYEIRQVVRFRPTGPRDAGILPDVEALSDTVAALYAKGDGKSSPPTPEELGKLYDAGRFRSIRDDISSTDAPPRHPRAVEVPLGLLLTYEEEWKPGGYTRGELITSLALAPGEETTIEVFSWDRSRIEQEQLFESGSESVRSGTITGRTSLDTVTSLRFKIAAGAEAGGEGSLSLAAMEVPVELGANASAQISGELEGSIAQTRSHLVEATRSATQTLRSSRKIRITQTSEVGSESRVTRRIVNPNRCHTLRFDYFEVLEHYDVEVRLERLQLVAMVPIPEVGGIDLSWLLCNEAAIRRGLPDERYAAGFEAARMLLAEQSFRRRITQPSPPSAPPASESEADEGEAEPDPIVEHLTPYVEDIVAACSRLRGADWSVLRDVVRRSFDFNPRNNPTAAQWQDAKKEAGQWLFAQEILLIDADFFDQVDFMKEKIDIDPSCTEQALRVFMAGASGVTIMLGLDMVKKVVGIPVAYDDAGLTGALVAAAAALQASRDAQPLPAAAVGQVPEIAEQGDQAKAPTVDERVDEAFGLRELSLAEVDAQRLLCYVRKHAERFAAAALSEGGPAAWAQLLTSYPHAQRRVQPVLFGVENGHALFPLQQAYQRKLEEDNRALLSSIVQSFGTDDEPLPVALPTHGVVMEARLGECEACEEFVRQHRRLDVELREQEVSRARQEALRLEAEVRRYDARLDADPPVLDDPLAPSGAVKVEVSKADDDG